MREKISYIKGTSQGKDRALESKKKKRKDNLGEVTNVPC